MVSAKINTGNFRPHANADNIGFTGSDLQGSKVPDRIHEIVTDFFQVKGQFRLEAQYNSLKLTAGTKTYSLMKQPDGKWISNDGKDVDSARVTKTVRKALKELSDIFRNKAKPDESEEEEIQPLLRRNQSSVPPPPPVNDDAQKQQLEKLNQQVQQLQKELEEIRAKLTEQRPVNLRPDNHEELKRLQSENACFKETVATFKATHEAQVEKLKKSSHEHLERSTQWLASQVSQSYARNHQLEEKIETITQEKKALEARVEESLKIVAQRSNATNKENLENMGRIAELNTLKKKLKEATEKLQLTERALKMRTMGNPTNTTRARPQAKL